ncbi:MAG: hypothetical protein JNM34_03130, partial [Chthonomonadaceae bacterium]|nr:hypothetical protein [Chthonomonadaceae bacterium]
YRIGGWKRSDGGVVHAMLWKKVGSDWQIETINDPDHVLDDRITWIADINDNGVCVGRIENSNSVPQGNEYIDATEQGGLFLYDPSDKVRRINLTGLEFAVPARINNNKEILVNRVENYVPLVSFVIPPDPNNAAIRGCNVSVRNLVVPAEYVPTTVYDFRDDRRWTGAASIGANSDGHISKVSTTVTHPTFTSVIVTGLTYVNGTSESGMYSLDGQAAEFQFTGTGEHSIEVRVQDSGAMSGYQLYGIVRAMTTGAYKVNTKLWRWQFGSFDNETGDQVFGSDSFTSDIGTNNGLDFIHNWGGGDKEYRAKMVFTPPTFSSGTPTVQVERIAFARVS